MGTWILIISLYYGGGITAEFNTQEACMTAARLATQQGTRNSVSFAVCAPKGEKK